MTGSYRRPDECKMSVLPHARIGAIHPSKLFSHSVLVLWYFKLQYSTSLSSYHALWYFILYFNYETYLRKTRVYVKFENVARLFRHVGFGLGPESRINLIFKMTSS